MKYYFERIFAKADISKISEKKEAVAFMLSEIAQYTDVVEREHWLMQLADIAHMDAGVLRDELKRGPSDKKVKTKTVEKSKEPIAKPKLTKQEKVVEFLLGLVLVNSHEYSDIFEKLSSDIINNENLQNVYKDAKEAYTLNKSSIDAQKSLFSILQQLYKEKDMHDLVSKIEALVLKTERILDGFQENHVREEIDRHLNILHQAPRKAHLLELERNIRQAEMAGDAELARKLTNEYMGVLKSS